MLFWLWMMLPRSLLVRGSTAASPVSRWFHLTRGSTCGSLGSTCGSLGSTCGSFYLFTISEVPVLMRIRTKPHMKRWSPNTIKTVKSKGARPKYIFLFYVPKKCILKLYLDDKIHYLDKKINFFLSTPPRLTVGYFKR